MPGLTAVSAAPAPSAASLSSGAQPSAPADLFGALLRGLAGGQANAQGKDDQDDDRKAGALLALANGSAAALPLALSVAQQSDPAGSGSAPRGSAGASIAAGDAPATGASAAVAALPPSEPAATTPSTAAPTQPRATDDGGTTSNASADTTFSQPAPVSLLHGLRVQAQGDPSSASDQQNAGAPLPVSPTQSGDSGSASGNAAAVPPPPPLPPALASRAIFVRRADAPNATFAVDLATLGAPTQPHATATAATPSLPAWTPPASPPSRPATSTTPMHTPPNQPAAQPAPGITTASSTATNSGSAGSDQGAQTALGTRGAAPATATFGVALGSGLDTSGLAASLALTIRSGVTEARLQLRPAGLGAVHVQITSGRDGVTLRLAAESTEAGDLLRAHAGDLRDALAGHGITVADLHILPNQPAPHAADSGGPAWQQDGGRRADRDPQDGGSGGDAPAQDDDDSGQPQ